MARTRSGGINAKRRAEWAARLARFKTSGLSVGAFAAQEGVRIGTLSWWRRKAAIESAPTTTPFVALAPVERRPAAMRSVPFEVLLASGLAVRVSPHFDASELTRLLVALDEMRR